MNDLKQLKEINIDEFVGYAQRKAREEESILCHSDIVKVLNYLNSFLKKREKAIKSDKIIFNNVYEKIIGMYNKKEIDEKFFAGVFNYFYKLEEKIKERELKNG